MLRLAASRGSGHRAATIRSLTGWVVPWGNRPTGLAFLGYRPHRVATVEVKHEHETPDRSRGRLRGPGVLHAGDVRRATVFPVRTDAWRSAAPATAGLWR